VLSIGTKNWELFLFINTQTRLKPVSVTLPEAEVPQVSSY
jgi:hypothetical protein